MKTPFSKKKITEIKTLKDANIALKELAENARQVETVKIEMNMQIDKIKTNAERLSSTPNARIKELEAAIELYAKENRSDIFGKGKSRKLDFGTIGYRSKSELDTVGDTSWENVACSCKKLGHDRAVNTTEKLDKNFVKGLTTEVHDLLGVRIVTGENFFAKPDVKKLENLEEGQTKKSKS